MIYFVHFIAEMFEMPKKFVTGLEKPGKKGWRPNRIWSNFGPVSHVSSVFSVLTLHCGRHGMEIILLIVLDHFLWFLQHRLQQVLPMGSDTRKLNSLNAKRVSFSGISVPFSYIIGYLWESWVAPRGDFCRYQRNCSWFNRFSIVTPVDLARQSCLIFWRLRDWNCSDL